MTYLCKQCGQCCRQVGKTIQGLLLANDNGVCRYLDEKSNLCTIYASRPVFCNVDKYYDLYFSAKMSRDEFYQLNMRCCKAFQTAKKNRT